jgi:hypothetical protein
MVIDSNIVHSGALSLRLRSLQPRARPGEAAMVGQSIPAAPFRGRVVRISGWLRTQEVDDFGAGLWVGVEREVGPAHGIRGENQYQHVIGTSDWTRHSLEFPVPSDATRIQFGAKLQGSGTAWFDDLEVTPLDVVPTPHRLSGVPARPAVDVAVSPDGERIAYSMGRGLQVLTLDTDEIRVVAAPTGTRKLRVLGWYPDSGSILIHRAREGDAEERWSEGFGEVWAVPVQGGNPSLLRREATCAAVSPTGDEVAFCLADQVVVDGPNGATRSVSSDLKPAQVVWSPNGERLAISGERGRPGVTLLSVAADGTNAQVVLSNDLDLPPFERSGIAWISGSRIVYANRHSTGVTLFAVPIDPHTGTPGTAAAIARIGATDVNNLYLSASIDGHKLVASVRERRIDVRVLRLGLGSGLERLTSGDGDEKLIGWAPEGDAVYFSRPGQNTGYNLYRLGLVDSDVSLLRSVGWMPVLAPDRKHVLEMVDLDETAGVHQGAEERRMALFSADISGGPAARIGSFDLPQREWPVVTCSGGCVLVRTVNRQGVVHDLDLEKGLGRELARIDAGLWSSNWALSNSGRMAIPQGNQLRVIDLATGREEPLAPSPACRFQDAAWGPDGRTLYATCIGSPWRGELVRIDRRGALKLLLADPVASFDKPMVSPRGDRGRAKRASSGSTARTRSSRNDRMPPRRWHIPTAYQRPPR